jgi:hypothetical protein
MVGGELRAGLDHDPAEHHRPPRRSLHVAGLRKRVSNRGGRRLGLAESGRQQRAQGDAYDKHDGNRKTDSNRTEHDAQAMRSGGRRLISPLASVTPQGV